MKVTRLNQVIGIISLFFVLQCSLSGYAIGATTSTEPNATAQIPALNEPNGPAPKLVFEQPIHDFGSVAPGSESKCSFKFANKGKGVLKIGDVTKTCGCTVFTLAKKDYEPGEEGVIEVSYNADRAPGVRTRKLYVLSNDPDNPRVELTIKANIAPKSRF
jgi:hypothetical protein